MTESSFLSDEKSCDAVVRNLEIIGEASNRLPEDFRTKHPEIEWVKIVGLRHRIVHEYFGVDLPMIWYILQHDLPSLRAALQQMMG